MTQDQPHGDLDELALLLGTGAILGDAPLSPEALAAQRRRRVRRRIAGSIAALLVVAVIAVYASLTLTAPVGSAIAAVQRPDAAAPGAAAIALPADGESAVSIAGADGYLGPTADGIFASSGGDAPRPMASISKLITAMVILNAKPLGASGTGPTITFGRADAALYDKYYVMDATIASMPAGSSMSEYDAIETMLVVSACNYAEAMADWAFGSNTAFLSAARTWLSAHGLTGTTMVEPTGIDPRNTSTPSDLIAIGKLAMADSAIASIVSKTSLDFPSPDAPALTGMPSTNDLLGTDGIDGIKTGTLDTNGSDLLFSATVPVGTPKPLTVIGVMLGGGSHASVDTAVESLISSIASGFHRVALGAKGEAVGTYTTPWGSQSEMVLARGASTLTWSNTPIRSAITTRTLKTGSRGERVGSVTWTAGKNTVTVPVVLKSAVPGPSALWRLTHPHGLLRR